MIYLPNESLSRLAMTNSDALIHRADVDALLLAVGDLVPTGVASAKVSREGSKQQALRSKSQIYVANSQVEEQIPQQRQQHGLQQRAAVVQQQVTIQMPVGNSLPDNLSIDSSLEPQMLSVWIDDRLAVVRSRPDGRGELEGVWVDWDSLHRSLIDDIDDLLPEARIRPARKDESVNPAYALASLPAVVVPGKIAEIGRSWSPTHTALLLSWAAFLVSAILSGFALQRLIALSDRRAAFVSAVTHELRTPLTTFRLYSDLLAREMVTDPSDRKLYLETLRREADRLTHLVDNVLRYSRLEQATKPTALERVVVSDWIERIQPRLRSRLAEAEMELVVEQSGDGDWRTDPPAMEQVLFNLIDNAAKYASGAVDRRVHLSIDVSDVDISLEVSDHGEGVPQSLRKSMFQPFSKSAQQAAETAAGVGLGLALVKRTVTSLGGKVHYQQTVGGGARFLVMIRRD